MRYCVSALWRLLLVSATLLTVGWDSEVAQANEPIDADVARRVAFILNFARYATWDGGTPVRFGGMFTLCSWQVPGTTKDPLESVKGQTIVGHQADSQVVQRKEELSRCNVLFIPEGASSVIESLQSDVRANRVLLITEMADKGAISLTKEGEVFSFSCDTKEAALSGIRLSSRMLKLAIEVK